MRELKVAILSSLIGYRIKSPDCCDTTFYLSSNLVVLECLEHSIHCTDGGTDESCESKSGCELWSQGG